MQAWVEEVTSQFRFFSAQTRVDCSSITWPAKQLLSLAHASYLRGSIRPVRPLPHALQTTAAIDSHAHDRRSVMRESQAKGQFLDRSSRDTKTRATGRRASRLSQREGWSHAERLRAAARRAHPRRSRHEHKRAWSTLTRPVLFSLFSPTSRFGSNPTAGDWQAVRRAVWRLPARRTCALRTRQHPAARRDQEGQRVVARVQTDGGAFRGFPAPDPARSTSHTMIAAGGR